MLNADKGKQRFVVREWDEEKEIHSYMQRDKKIFHPVFGVQFPELQDIATR